MDRQEILRWLRCEDPQELQILWDWADQVRRVHVGDAVHLRDGALASSSPHAITFDASGQVSHILDPRSGAAAPATWRLVSVTAPRAALADALSTACCLMDRAEITAALVAFPGAALAHAG